MYFQIESTLSLLSKNLMLDEILRSLNTISLFHAASVQFPLNFGLSIKFLHIPKGLIKRRTCMRYGYPYSTLLHERSMKFNKRRSKRPNIYVPHSTFIYKLFQRCECALMMYIYVRICVFAFMPP